jgi:hypothetical protein
MLVRIRPSRRCSGGRKVCDQPDALGVRPSLHGRIRLSPKEAQWLEAWDPVGVPIQITAWPGLVQGIG